MEPRRETVQEAVRETVQRTRQSIVDMRGGMRGRLGNRTSGWLSNWQGDVLGHRWIAQIKRNAPSLLFAGAAALVVVLLAALLVPALALAGVAADGSARGDAASSQSNASTDASLPVAYVNSLLGFSVHLPAGWSARTEPVVHSRASTTGERNALVSLHDPAHASDQIEIAVTESQDMLGAFARLGTPDTHVGPYPAFTRDIPVDPSDPASVASGPCVVRIFLAHTSQRADYVVAQACGVGITGRAGEFQAALATYLPAAPKTGAAITLGTQDTATPTPVSQPATCAQLVASATQRPADLSNWGRELASATDPRWNPYPTPAASVCSNFYYVNGKLVSYSGYTFQCVELANRFLREQWGHGGVNGNAAEWFDYYLNGTRFDGRARIYPDAQLSDDASQGISAFKPGPGDILVWQDVQDGASWTSGLRNSPGHVAVITGTDATHVYFMQQNYNEQHYYMSLPLTKVAAGWKITDNVSGVPGRIVRGWIHFTENGGSSAAASPISTTPPTLSTSNAQDVYTIGADGQLYAYDVAYSVVPGTNASVPQSPHLVSVAGEQHAPVLTGTPSLNVYQLDGQSLQSVYVTGSDGHLYEYANGAKGWTRNDLTVLAPLPSGVTIAGSPAALTYSLPGLTLLRHVVFAPGSNGVIYRFVWTEGGAWQVPTALPGSVTVVPGPLAAITWAQAAATPATPTATPATPTPTRYEAVYVIRADGHLYEDLSSDGATWQQTDLSAQATSQQASSQPKTMPSLAGTPSAYTFTAAADQPTQRIIFALGADGHLYSYSPATGSSSGPASWSVTDVSTAATDGPKIGANGSGGSGLTLVGSPSALYAPAIQQPSETSHEVYVTGSDGHLYEYFYTTGWHGADVSTATGVPTITKLNGAPLGFSFALPGDQSARRSIFAVTQSGTLAELRLAPLAGSTTPAWSFVDHGSPDGMTFGAGTLAGATWTR